MGLSVNDYGSYLVALTRQVSRQPGCKNLAEVHLSSLYQRARALWELAAAGGDTDHLAWIHGDMARLQMELIEHGADNMGNYDLLNKE